MTIEVDKISAATAGSAALLAPIGVDDGHLSWERILEILRAELTPASFSTCFDNAQLLNFDGQNLTIGAANRFVKACIDTNHLSRISAAARQIFAREIAVKIVISPELFRQHLRQRSEENSATSAGRGGNSTNNKVAYSKKSLFATATFADFVVGRGNEFAFAAAKKVVTHRGEFSPLLLCGGSGLGKTYLLHAICNEFAVADLKVVCLSAENFVRAFGKATLDRRLPAFRERFAEADLLAIDDLQMFSEGQKTASQKELTQVIEAVARRGAQVVCTSTLPLNQLENLLPPLASRLRQGLSASIEALDIPTRREFLLTRISPLVPPAESVAIADYLSNHLNGDVRELEGILKTLRLQTTFRNVPLNLAAVREILATMLTQTATAARVPAQEILAATAQVYGVTLAELCGKKRLQSVARARRVAAHLCRQLTTGSLTEIGAWLGGRTHATVISLLKTPPFVPAQVLEKTKFAAVLARLGQTICPDEFCRRQSELFT